MTAIVAYADPTEFPDAVQILLTRIEMGYDLRQSSLWASGHYDLTDPAPIDIDRTAARLRAWLVMARIVSPVLDRALIAAEDARTEHLVEYASGRYAEAVNIADCQRPLPDYPDHDAVRDKLRIQSRQAEADHLLTLAGLRNRGKYGRATDQTTVINATGAAPAFQFVAVASVALVPPVHPPLRGGGGAEGIPLSNFSTILKVPDSSDVLDMPLADFAVIPNTPMSPLPDMGESSADEGGDAFERSTGESS